MPIDPGQRFSRHRDGHPWTRGDRRRHVRARLAEGQRAVDDPLRWPGRLHPCSSDGVRCSGSAAREPALREW